MMKRITSPFRMLEVLQSMPQLPNLILVNRQLDGTDKVEIHTDYFEYLCFSGESDGLTQYIFNEYKMSNKS